MHLRTSATLKPGWNGAVLAAGAVAAMIGTAGCTQVPQHWYKPGATARGFEDDSYTCQVHAGLTVQRFYSGELAGLQALAEQEAQRKTYVKCMQAYGWTPTDNAAQASADGQPVQEAARRMLVKERESESTEPVCGLGCYFTKVPGLIASTSERARAWGLRAGDQIVAIDGERLLPPGRPGAVLDKRKPGDTVLLTLRNDGVERTLPVECTDRRLTGNAVIAALEAMAQGRWDECAARTSELEQLSGPSAAAAYLRTLCTAGQQAASGHATDAEVAASLYEFMRRLMSEARLTPAGVESVRPDVLKAIAQLDQWGFPTFAHDLKSQLDTANAEG